MPSDFKAIHHACCRSNGRLYEDPYFETIDENVFYSRKLPRPIVWKRPGEIVQEPHLFVDGASRLDIQQGRLDNSWFVAALSSLSQYPSLLHKVIPADYGFSNDYAGVFRVNFWLNGQWEEVVIDDRLPTLGGELAFAHSKEKNEFWAALVEKAYAKVHGSYEALKTGSAAEAMVDFTSGVVESFHLGSKAPDDLFQIILDSVKRQSLMGCSITAKPNETGITLDNGLVKGQNYTLTGAKKVTVRTSRGEMEIELVRVRNPWVNEIEWNGPWSDKSQERNYLSGDEKRELGLTLENDGEFWMSYTDWLSNFHRLQICFLNVGGEDPFEIKIHRDSWRIGISAGGCRNNPNTFHRNPQFRFQVEKKKEGEGEDEWYSVVISLMQTGRRILKEKGQGYLTIGFAIYKLDEEDSKHCRLTRDFFLYHASTAQSSTFVSCREITNRFRFQPGTYCIVPSTYNVNEEGDFVLRIFTEKANVTSNSSEVSNVERQYLPKLTPEQSAYLDAKYKSSFMNLAGEDGVMGCYELKELLSSVAMYEMGGEEVSLSLCRLLMRFFDLEFDGKLSFDEFKEMFGTFKHYLASFRQFDMDRSKDCDLYELNDTLESIGLTVGARVLCSLVMEHSNKRGCVPADGFVEIALKIQLLSAAHSKLSGKSFTLEDLVSAVI